MGANGYPYAYTTVTGDTVNNLSRSGLYWFADETNPLYADGYNSGVLGLLLHLQGSAVNTISARQIFFPNRHVSGAGSNCRVEREKTSEGEWLPWEFVNPPIVHGFEYRTTERYLGKPVYVKAIDFGSLPNNTLKVITFGDSTIKMISAHGIMNGGYVIPGCTGSSDYPTQEMQIITYNGGNVGVMTHTDRSNHTAVIVAKYWKTTD